MTTGGIVETVQRWWATSHPPKGMVGIRGIYDEPKFDGRVMSQAEYLAYCKDLRSKNALLPVQLVVVHHSATAESAYAKQTLAQVLRNWWSYYRVSKGWSGAPHGVIMTRDPGIGLLNSMLFDGIHVSGHNTNSRGAEIVGVLTNVLPTGLLLDNAVVCFAGMLYAGKMNIGALKMHRSLNATQCPGNKLAANWAWFAGLVDAKLQALIAAEQPPPPPPPPPDPPPIPTDLAVLTAKVAAHGRLIVELEQANRDRMKDVADINQDIMSHGAVLENHEGRIAALEAMNGDGK